MRFELFLAFLFLFNLSSFSQDQNSSNGYFVVKANTGFFIDDDHKRLVRGNPGYDYIGVRNYQGPFSDYSQQGPVVSIFPGCEIDYYLNRNNFFGFNVGFAYSYDKTYYSFGSGQTITNGSSESYFLISGSGKGSLKNNMFKLAFGFSFNSKKGLNFYIQPLNPEIRCIRNGRSSATYETKEVLRSKKINNDGSRSDSTYTIVSTETKNHEFVNYKTRSNISIAFPTLIGIEQKFKINRINYVVGISGAFSILEWYSIYRIHFGICFGNFKGSSQPGY